MSVIATSSATNGQIIFTNTRSGKKKTLSQGCIDAHTEMLLHRMGLKMTPEQKKMLEDDYIETIKKASTIWE